MHFVEAKGILSAKNGMNLYRGCTHGCIYCDSRSVCYGFQHAFEDIEVKKNAPELLEQKLRSKRKRCMIGTGAMCDPYMHCEEELQLTRTCLALIDQYEYGVALQTKSARVLRDLDLLTSINRKTKAVVQMTLTTYDDALCSIIEPHVSLTSERIQTLKTLHEAGLPTIVWMTPILPWINDTRENISNLLQGCVDAGVKGVLTFGMGVTLREGNREYFYRALDQNFPGLKEKYIRTYGYAYELSSPHENELIRLVYDTCEKNGMMHGVNEIFTYLQHFPEKNEYQQLSFHDLF